MRRLAIGRPRSVDLGFEVCGCLFGLRWDAQEINLNRSDALVDPPSA